MQRAVALKLLEQRVNPIAWELIGDIPVYGKEKYVSYSNKLDQYWGQVNEEGQNHGQGTMVYANCGSVYTGEWKNGLKHGKGKLTFGNEDG